MSRFTLTRRGGLAAVERTVRIVGGLGLTMVAVFLLRGSSGPAVLAWVVVALLGLGFIATGAGGYCPLYARLGFGRSRLIGGLRYGKD
jgi:hypothetical protein